MSSDAENSHFAKLVGDITSIGQAWHAHALVDNSRANRPFMTKSIRDLAMPTGAKAQSAIVISAGPSLYKNDILARIKACNFQGSIIAIDGSYVRCLKAGITPDYVLTLDPHPSRIVRWFGDPDLVKNLDGDDYFSRQDLDIQFRNNSVEENRKNIELVNQHGRGQKLVICSPAPANVVARVAEVGFDAYWWAPLVDDPSQPDGLTRTIVRDTGLPAMNTGGTVGTAAWVFALTVLRIPNIAAVGMDLGYYKSDTPHEKTQTYHTLKDHVGPENLEKYFVDFSFPGSEERFYTDPTYFWYRGNLLSLLAASKTTLYNCTGGGTLVGDGVECISIEDFCRRETARTT